MPKTLRSACAVLRRSMLPVLLIASAAQAAPGLLYSKALVSLSVPCKQFGCVLLKTQDNADPFTGKKVNTSYLYSLKGSTLKLLVFRDMQDRLLSFNAFDSDIDVREAQMLTEFVRVVTGRSLTKNLYQYCIAGPRSIGTRTEIAITLDSFVQGGQENEVACSIGLDGGAPDSAYSLHIGKSAF